MTSNVLNLTAIGVTIGVLVLLTRKSVMKSVLWNATITPLASIIGSGFLIIAPLLHAVFGKWALLAMIVLSVLSYGIGHVVRLNILYLNDPKICSIRKRLVKIDRFSQVFLGFAYAISVAFYINLFSSFVLNQIGLGNPFYIRITTTASLIGIMVLSWWWGTRGLETVELVAVTIKLSVIIGVLISLAGFDFLTQTSWFQHEPIKNLSLFEKSAMLGGMLMVNQGFETTRFMGKDYPTMMRVNAAKFSQWIAIIIYILFIGLTCPIFLKFPIVELTETTISSTLGKAVPILPFLLLGAAIASQLSAALADTIGGGGLLREFLSSSLPTQYYYIIVISLAMVLIWVSNIFEIINLASKGFSVYFFFQAIIAFRLIPRHMQGRRRFLNLFLSFSLMALLAFIIFFSISAPHS